MQALSKSIFDFTPPQYFEHFLRKKMKNINILTFFILTTSVCTVYAQKQTAIYPKEIWKDADSNHIQAHGGGIIKVRKTYYWYGEQRRQGLDTNYRYVSCYASKDLINWKFQGDAIKLAKPDTALQGNKWVLERPKVYFNAKTKKYVMYMHIDGALKSSKYDFAYDFASVGVAVSDKPTILKLNKIKQCQDIN